MLERIEDGAWEIEELQRKKQKIYGGVAESGVRRDKDGENSFGKKDRWAGKEIKL